MTSKSLNLKYIEISDVITTSDISLFLESLESISIEDAKVVYSYIKKDLPMTNKDINYCIGKNDLYHLDDKEGLAVKNYIISLCNTAIEKIIYPIVGAYPLEETNIEGCFTLLHKDSFLVGTTGTKISFGNNNFINQYHILFFLLKRYKFPKIN